MNISKLIDHTLLRPDAPLGEYTQLVRDAIRLKLGAICVSSFHTPLVYSLLHSYVHTDMNLDIKVASTIGFPFGINNITSKCREMEVAFNDGATEFDFVINLSAVKTSDWKRVKDELKQLRNTLPDFWGKFHPVLKCILEVGLLTDDEIKHCCDLAMETQIDFVKSSTGFNIKLEPKDTAKYIKLMSEHVKGSNVLVKASGGIKTLNDVNLMLENGASRIGTSNSVSILEEILNEQTKGK